MSDSQKTLHRKLDIVDNARINFKMEMEHLKKISRPLEELIVREKFTVNNILSESVTRSFTPASEMVFGGRSPGYESGYISSAILEVVPENDIPVETIKFNGITPARGMDHISALIPRYDEKLIHMEHGYDRPEYIYFDRDFRGDEKAIEISIISPKGRVLRIDRSVEYGFFMRK